MQASRIKEEGLIQPVVLNRVGEGQYRIIAGHMRVEVCMQAVVRDEGWGSVEEESET